MPDIGQLSDADLLTSLGQQPATTGRSLSDLSDAELKAALAKAATIGPGGQPNPVASWQDLGKYGEEAVRGVPILGGVAEQMGLPKNEEFQAQHRLGSMVAQGAGALATGAGAGAVAPKMLGAGLQELPTAERAVHGFLTGGGIGTLDAHLRGQNPLTGFAFGAGGGAAAPIVGQAVGSGAGKLADALTRRQVPAEIRSLPEPAQRIFTDMARRDFANPQTVAQAQASHPQSFFYESGPNFKALATDIVQNTNEGKNVITNAIGQRTASALPAVESVLDTAMGPRVDLPARIAQMEQSRKAAADPLYEMYRNAVIPMTPDLQKLVTNPYVKQALPGAAKLAAGEGKPILDPNGNPTAATWDYVKQSLYDMETRSRDVGRATNETRVISGIRHQVTDGVDGYFANHPDPVMRNLYSRARQAYAAPSEIIDAYETGGQAFRRNYPLEQLQQDFPKMSPPAQQAYIQSARDDISHAMRTGGMTREGNELLTPDSQDKLRFLLGPKADPLIAELAARKGHREADQFVLHGSPTAGREFVDKSIESAVQPRGVVGGILRYGEGLNITEPASLLGLVKPTIEKQSEQQGEFARNALAPLLIKQGADKSALLSAALASTRQRPSETLTPYIRNLVTRLSAGGAQGARAQLQE